MSANNQINPGLSKRGSTINDDGKSLNSDSYQGHDDEDSEEEDTTHRQHRYGGNIIQSER